VTGLLHTVIGVRGLAREPDQQADVSGYGEVVTSTTSQSDPVASPLDEVPSGDESSLTEAPEPAPVTVADPPDSPVTVVDAPDSPVTVVDPPESPVTVAEPPDGSVVETGDATGTEAPEEPADAPTGPPEPPGVDGPEAEPVLPRPRRPRWAIALIAVGTVIILLAAGTYATLVGLGQRYDKALPKAPLLDPSARAQAANPGDAITGPLNFLMLGSDARPMDTELGQRSDTIIILHIPASLDRAYLISIPRDLRVHIPADPDTGFHGSHEKINGAFSYGGGGIGGFQLVSKTITELMGVKFDGAAIVDFLGFHIVVDQLGGVRMCVDEETKSIHTGVVFEPGCQHMTGWQALDYVRQRETLPNGDYDRQRHQQQFLRAILQEARNQGLVRNPVKLDQFVRSIEGSMVVDTNGVSVVDLAFALRNVTPSTIVGVRLPSHPEYIGGISYVLADEGAPSLYQAIAQDTLDNWVTDHPEWVNPV
jgi:LCP family protein required for cell wall assembly